MPKLAVNVMGTVSQEREDSNMERSMREPCPVTVLLYSAFIMEP